MELSEPSGSSYGQIAGMEARRLSVTPGSGGSSSSGNGGRSSGSTSSRRRRRMSNLPSGTRLMAQFNAAADGWGSGLRSFVGLEHVLDEWRRHHIRVPSLPEALPMPRPPPLHLARLLFMGPPMRSPAADDNVLIMDGVPIGNSGSRIASNIRRSASFSGPFAAGTLGSSGGSNSGSNGQFSLGMEELLRRRIQATRQRISDVVLQSSGWFGTGSPNMQGSPINPHLFPPSLQGPAFLIAAPRAVSSYTDAAVTVRPPASYFTLPRVTVSAARPSPWSPHQPETEPVQPSPPPPPTMSFTWPPTADEDASFAQQLYGPTARRRLPVFEAICPEEGEE